MFDHLRLIALATMLATTACGTSDPAGGAHSSDLGSSEDTAVEVDPVIELDTGGLPASAEPDVAEASSAPPGASVTGAVVHTSSAAHSLSVGVGAGTPSVERKSSNYRLRFRTPGL
jgi:hypothetical protein